MPCPEKAGQIRESRKDRRVLNGQTMMFPRLLPPTTIAALLRASRKIPDTQKLFGAYEYRSEVSHLQIQTDTARIRAHQRYAVILLTLCPLHQARACATSESQTAGISIMRSIKPLVLFEPNLPLSSSKDTYAGEQIVLTLQTFNTMPIVLFVPLLV